ncbi:MAG: DNA gyrase C-terminal beta-propeller domain-containing protein, partial [Nitratireductor sp.]
NDRNGPLISSFPVEDEDQIMLVSDGGTLIRCPISGIRVAGRSTQGVTVFSTSKDEKVVSVEHISESDEEDDVEAVEADASESVQTTADSAPEATTEENNSSEGDAE